MLRKAGRLIPLLTAAVLLLTLTPAPWPGAAVALADGSLKRGDTGKAVEALQKLLKQHDCYDYGEFTGYFGASTEAGVRKFQAQNDLKVDGIAGADTMAKLKLPKNTTVKNADSLCLGMSGTKVEEIQKRLKDIGLFTEPEITGYYGPKTEKAVKLFQEAQGMKVDGIVGKNTRAALFTSFKSTTMLAGVKGDNVKKLQERMKKLGYYKGPVTSLYGQLTESAVKYFQKLNGLKQDGVCGKATYNAIFAKNAKSEKDAKRSRPDAPDETKKPAYTDTPAQSAEGQEKGQAIVEFAKQQLGKKYVYATSGPNTFDCTGLTCYVYKHFGVSLPRSAKDQGAANFGIKITSRSKLMPGDLVYFKKSSGVVHHAGIYVGGGNFIHAPYTGTVVRINSVMTARDFAWGKRVYR